MIIRKPFFFTYFIPLKLLTQDYFWNIWQKNLLFNAMSSSNGPVFVQQGSSALVQVGWGSPLAQWNLQMEKTSLENVISQKAASIYLPRPLGEGGPSSTHNPAVRQKPPSANYKEIHTLIIIVIDRIATYNCICILSPGHFHWWQKKLLLFWNWNLGGFVEW